MEYPAAKRVVCLKDYSFGRRGYERSLTIYTHILRRECEAKISDNTSEPRHCEPHQSSHLKRDAETEGGLIRVYRIAPILGRPLVND